MQLIRGGTIMSNDDVSDPVAPIGAGACGSAAVAVAMAEATINGNATQVATCRIRARGDIRASM